MPNPSLSSFVGNDETEAKLEEAAFLPAATHILRYGISRVPAARGAAAGSQADSGTNGSGQKEEAQTPDRICSG
ncbi:hypothetical protein ACFSQU_05195 [Massilia sp. GCM10020059]|uniref:Uncharacterized protein n=1 Tax=Massilia agrisoli TaxID=2892444 RepID=A0ABS8J0V4_9BURK|nr:hypothetical protein [Massilia agrisoli]MCC6073114.1 hypothetical protein [Massilia agrisoli]